jgi:hypothetical protein
MPQGPKGLNRPPVMPHASVGTPIGHLWFNLSLRVRLRAYGRT